MGVTVYFDTEILGKKTDGPQVIMISFEEAKDIFEPKYIYKDKDYVFPVVAGNMNIHFDIDGDGKQENVSVDPVYNQNAKMGRPAAVSSAAMAARSAEPVVWMPAKMWAVSSSP